MDLCLLSTTSTPTNLTDPHYYEEGGGEKAMSIKGLLLTIGRIVEFIISWGAKGATACMV